VIGWRRFQAVQQGVEPDFLTRLLWPMLSRYVVTPVLKVFGAKIRVAVSGGAPLDQAIACRLIGLGLPLIEGYGLTEAGPVVAANGLGDNLPGSVGRPLQGIEVKFAAEGILQVRSPSMMSGYWRDEAETARRLDPAGWLSTGDLAEIKDGRIYIRGRVNEIIVLSIGEKVNPELIEIEIKRDPLFAQVMVTGHGRPYLVALAVLDQANWKRFSDANGIATENPDTPEGRMHILRHLEQRLSNLPRFAQVRAVHLTLEPWTIDAGLLTPTLKIKRDVLQRRFAKEIDNLYK
jgi:long-chain acyl-CoA synthetase